MTVLYLLRKYDDSLLFIVQNCNLAESISLDDDGLASVFHFCIFLSFILSFMI